MKILVDARLYGLEHAGLGRYTLNLIQGLTRQDKNNNYVILLRNKYFDQLKLPVNWKKVLVDIRHYSFKEQLLLPLIIQKHKPDLVHFPHFNVPVFYFGKYVVTIHDILMHKFKGGEVTTLPAPFYLIRRFGYRIAFEKAIRSSQEIIVPSKAVKEEIVKHHKLDKGKIAVTYEGLDKSYLTKPKDIKKVLTKYGLFDKLYFFYVGNAYPHKNLKRAIEAVILLNSKSDNKVVLAIAGSRDVFKKRLEKQVSELNAGKYVKLLGFVPDKEMKVLYQNSIAFLYPSLSEGFGLQGLEAMASDALILCSDIPVFREVYKDNAIYFDPFKLTAITKAMENAIAMNESKKKQIMAKAQKFIKRYSWGKMVKETLHVYKEVVK